MIRRGHVALAVLLLWIAGLATLGRRELFRGMQERLAIAALRVSPGAVYYAVLHEGHQIGFASSTIDTSETAITIADYLVSDLPVGKSYHRATAWTNVRLTRALRLTEFDASGESQGAPVRVAGRITGDSLLSLVVSTAGEPADTQHIRLDGHVLLPTLVPLAVALAQQPGVGRRYTVPIFDPAVMQRVDAAFTIDAESLFVIPDSAAWDSTAAQWTTALLDTVRAWHLVSDDRRDVSSWVDAQGRIVEARLPGGFMLRRAAYELAFENWRVRARHRSPVPSASRDILEVTAVAANASIDRDVQRLRVRLGDVDLVGYDLNGGRQTLRGDTLTVEREPMEVLRADYTLGDLSGEPFAAELSAEPLIQSRHPTIRALAARLVGGERDPVIVARRITQWVHDSLRKEITVGVPNALRVLRARTGDCSEHTQLFLALSRAAGIPARGTAGLALVRGKFYYHAWPEVYLGRWIAVDPTFGQFPADAAHLRFITGGLARQAELLRLIGTLQVEVLDEA